MAWVVGSPTSWGYGFRLSDIRVTLGNGDEVDCLQKIHPVGRYVAAGFAGDVEIGFRVIDEFRRLAGIKDERVACAPECIGKERPSCAQPIFERFPDGNRAGECALIRDRDCKRFTHSGPSDAELLTGRVEKRQDERSSTEGPVEYLSIVLPVGPRGSVPRNAVHRHQLGPAARNHQLGPRNGQRVSRVEAARTWNSCLPSSVERRHTRRFILTASQPDGSLLGSRGEVSSPEALGNAPCDPSAHR